MNENKLVKSCRVDGLMDQYWTLPLQLQLKLHMNWNGVAVSAQMERVGGLQEDVLI